MHTALVIVDLASDKIVVDYVDGCINQKPTALQAKRCFAEGWLDWASRVERIQIDQDSAFRSTFSQLADDLGIAKVPVPSESHWQHGRVERKVQFLKHMSMKVFKDLQVNDAVSCKVALAQMSGTCNRLTQVSGFSPDQWVLGSGVVLPASTADPENDPAVVSRIEEGSDMWHRLHVQEVCEVAFFRTANNQALRRQILSKARPQPGPFEPGAWLMYWRTGGLKKDLQRVLARTCTKYW